VSLLPILRDDDSRVKVLEYCDEICNKLKELNIRVNFDTSDERTSNKMWGAIKKGIPLRVEVGPRDMEAGQVTHTRRDLGKPSQNSVSKEEFFSSVEATLEEIQNGLYKKASDFELANTHEVKNLDEVYEFYKTEQLGFVSVDISALDDPKFEAMQKEFSISARCIPFESEAQKVILGKSY